KDSTYVVCVSALGHKRTYAPQQAMSALHPIATTKADIGKPSCLLYPRKRTCAVQQLMSALGQKRTFHSFDHLVGNQQKVASNRQAERSSCLQIDYQLEFGRLLYR